MAKKRGPKKKHDDGLPATGATYLHRHGLVTLTVPVSRQVRTAVARAAAQTDPPTKTSRWLASVIEEAARLALAEAGLPWPVEESA